MADEAPRDRDAAACPPALRCPDGADDVIVCHVADLAAPDLAIVHVLARLQVVARRAGHRTVFCHAPQALVDLVDLVGLADVLDVRSVVEMRREPEEREQPIGAKEGVHGLDLPT